MKRFYCIHALFQAGPRGPRLRPSTVICGLLLAPMGTAIEIPSDSTVTSATDVDDPERVTRFTFGAGSGTYGRTIHAERTIFLGIDDCTGAPNEQHVDANFKFKNEFKDYGGEIDVQAGDHFHIGVRGGWVNETATFRGSSLDQAVIDTLFSDVQFRDSTLSYTYVNPFIAIEKETAGFGIGVVFSDSRLWTDKVREYEDYDDASVYPTGHIRLGRLDEVYVKASLWESVPIYSGGGMTVVGLGAHIAPPLDVFAGIAGGGPYEGSAILLRGNLALGRYFTLGGTYRMSDDVEDGFSPSFEQSGGSASLTYNLHH